VTAAAIDYQIGYDCALKRRFTLQELAPLLHGGGGPDTLRRRYRPPYAEGEEPPTLTRTSPAHGRLEPVEIEPAEVARRADALVRARRSCRDCPANLWGKRDGFGCFGFVKLPLLAEAESGLMRVIERLMEGGDATDAGAAIPIRFVWDNGVGGEAVGVLREEEGWFELDEPVVSRVGPFLEKRPVSSDQVLEVFLAYPRFGLEYAVMFGAFLAEFGRVFEELGEEAAWAAELARYFEALQLAGELAVDTQVTALRPAGEEEEDEEEG